MKVFVTGGTGYLGQALVPEGLVTRRQMVSALVRCVEQPHEGLRIVDVPEIRAARI